MPKMKFYAVRAGRKPGIYTVWEEAEAQVKGFAGAQFKSFDSAAEARAWLRGDSAPAHAPSPSQPALLEVEPKKEPAPAAGPGEVVLFTDGGAIHNPGPGGYGAVLISDGQRKELSGGFRRTTNNRMELMAVIAGLSALPRPARVRVYTDSRYVANGVEKGWARRWQAAGWRRPAGPVPNADLWARLLELLARHEVRFEWVRGHTGVVENERCDRLAMQAATRPNLPVDEGYQQGV